jgi:hypothetical protein
VVGGQFIGIEVKAWKRPQSDHQKEFQKKLEAAGGKYILAYDLVTLSIRFSFPLPCRARIPFLEKPQDFRAGKRIAPRANRRQKFSISGQAIQGRAKFHP